MTATQWQTVGVIAAIVFGFAGVYLARQSATREMARIREQEKAKAIEDAERPLRAEIAAHLATIAQQRQDAAQDLAAVRQEKDAAIAAQREQFREQLTAVRDACSQQLATANRTIDSLNATVSKRNDRIDVLEDELRRGRGHGDSDAQRQPPNG